MFPFHQLQGIAAKQLMGVPTLNDILDEYRSVLPAKTWLQDVSLDGTALINDYSNENGPRKIYAVPVTRNDAGKLVMASRDKWTELQELSLFVAKIIAKEKDPVAFVVGGAYKDRDGQWITREVWQSVAKGVAEGTLTTSIDIGHIGFPTAANPKPTEDPVIVGKWASATFAEDHLGIVAKFFDADVEQAVRDNADDLELSVWLTGVKFDKNESKYTGAAQGHVSVAILQKGKAAYPYTSIS